MQGDETAGRTLAAVDLGSNSFHMVVAREQEGQLQVLDRLKEMVRLAAGLDEHNDITPDAMERALACLERFGQRLRELPRENVRIVGTNTLRKARNSRKFMRLAGSRLGHPIEIISGIEEARLIYLGVSHSLEEDGERRLVMDIGGGSTEFILGQHFQPQEMESLYMGCVSMSRRFFGDGRLSEKRMRNAVIAARQELEGVEARFRALGWDHAIGASGSLLAIRDVVVANDWSRQGITAESLCRLREALLLAGHVEELDLAGLQPERRDILPGALAIVLATFEGLEIRRMKVSQGALREGLLYDLMGRIHHEDVRENTVQALMRRFSIDAVQAARVERTALALQDQAARAWNLDGEAERGLLSRAARLHEIGLAISHSQFHKHGAYLLSNMDLAGFSRSEQAKIAALVRAHRRKFPKEPFRQFLKEEARRLRRQAVLLRLAVLLNRSRSDGPLPELEIDGHHLRLRFAGHWLDANPLTRADLEQEAQTLQVTKFRLSFE